MAENLKMSFILMGAGLFVVFFSLLLFYVSIKIFNKLFPEIKDQKVEN